MLKSKGWATGLSAGVGEGGYDHSSAGYMFSVNIHLTDSGSEKVIRALSQPYILCLWLVLAMVFSFYLVYRISYIRLLRVHQSCKRILVNILRGILKEGVVLCTCIGLILNDSSTSFLASLLVHSSHKF